MYRNGHRSLLTTEEVRAFVITSIMSMIDDKSQSQNTLAFTSCKTFSTLSEQISVISDRLECIIEYSERKLPALQTELVLQGLDGFILPRTDEHQSENIPLQAERLYWLTGFTGSSGIAVVLQSIAALFVDNRYAIQAEIEISHTFFICHCYNSMLPSYWINTYSILGTRIGYDPWLHTPENSLILEWKGNLLLQMCQSNPIDSVWCDQPNQWLAPVILYTICYTGLSSIDKIRAVSQKLDGAQAFILSALDSIAWLLNIRGNDVPYTPLTLAYAILYANSYIDLFTNGSKLTSVADYHFGKVVRVLPREDFVTALDALGECGACVCIDKTSTSIEILSRLYTSGAHITFIPNPCSVPQACKNEVELRGSRTAHHRDGIALIQFFCWLYKMVTHNKIVNEISATKSLEAFRNKKKHFQGLSFSPISASGSNGSIVHYHPMEVTNRSIKDDLYLIDSGAQYLDGTTDVTRTISVNSICQEKKRRFTQVLKGHLSLSTSVFPSGTIGTQLDILARYTLWTSGIDYGHGTGHGVGHYLNVHEGPHCISTSSYMLVSIFPGMIISNEPGYYQSGSYGIRIENLLSVRPTVLLPFCSEHPLLEFDVLTLVPIDCTLIDTNLLSLEEEAWIDIYHACIVEVLSPFVDPESNIWLDTITASLRGNKQQYII